MSEDGILNVVRGRYKESGFPAVTSGPLKADLVDRDQVVERGPATP